MYCPICDSEMKRDYDDLAQWKCNQCGYDALCRKCMLNPVHPHRKWQLCLDCICDMLDESGSVTFQNKWKEYRNDWQSETGIRIKNQRTDFMRLGDGD
jgi:hypothetical protein